MRRHFAISPTVAESQNEDGVLLSSRLMSPLSVDNGWTDLNADCRVNTVDEKVTTASGDWRLQEYRSHTTSIPNN